MFDLLAMAFGGAILPVCIVLGIRKLILKNINHSAKVVKIKKFFSLVLIPISAAIGGYWGTRPNNVTAAVIIGLIFFFVPLISRSFSKEKNK